MSIISALPPAPSRSDPATFSDKADALLGALDGFVSETNTVAGEVVTNKDSSATSAATATTQAGIATTQASNASTSASTATTQAGIATTGASTATTQAGIATAAASTATTQAGIATAAAASINLASPAAIGNVTPNTGAFTTLSATGNATFSANAFFTDANRFIAASGSNLIVGADGSGAIDLRAAGVVRATVSSTGVAVTGAVSTTGYGLIGTTVSTGAGVSRGQVGRTADTTAGFLVQSATAHAVLFASGTADTYLFVNTGNAFRIGHGPADGSSFSEKVQIDASGNLGLGVTPSAWLSSWKAIELGSGAFVYPNDSASFRLTQNWYLNSGATAVYKANGLASQYIQASGTHQWYTAPSGTAGNTVTFTQAMTLDASGNLLVGTTSTGVVNSNSFNFRTATGDTNVNHITGTASGVSYFNFGYGGGVIGSVTQSGTTAVLYNTTSDARLKTNIADASDAADLIDSLQVRQFDWLSDGSHQRYGFVAQELYEVAPEAVSKPQDPDEMMAVDYSKLVPMLVKELQSVRARLAQLEGI